MRTLFNSRSTVLPTTILAWVQRAGRLRAAQRVLAVCLAAAAFPSVAHAIGTIDTATPAQPSLAFNPAAVGIASAQAQQMMAEFTVAGTDALSVSLYYGKEFTAGAISCGPNAGGQTCLVPITFIPTLPGARKDALFLLDGTTVIATVYLGGVGQSPLALIQPGVVTQLISASPTEVSPLAVDEIGTVYLQTETGTGAQILSVSQGGNTPDAVSTLPIQVVAPQFGAIDGAGILYISNANPNTVEDLITWNTVNGTQGSIAISPPPPYAPCFTTEYLTGVAADPKGNLFVIEAECQQVFELMPGGVYATRAIQPQISGDFFWLAIDSSDNAFAGSIYQINELLANKTQSQLTNLGDPATSGLAVDAADTLYVKLGNVGGVTELPAINYQTSQGLMDTLNWSGGFILGSDGSLYVGHAGTDAGAGNGNLDKVDRSQGAIDFGQQTQSTPSTTQTVQLYNGGNQALTLYNISLAGAGYGYAIQSAGSNNCVNGLVIAPGELCQLAINLTATQGGTLNGKVYFSTNSGNNDYATSTVTLTSVVPGPYATLTPNPLAFGNQTVGVTSPASLTLSNPSSYPLTGITVTLTGADASDFAIVPASNVCGSTLPAESSCFIDVTFTPQAAGSRTATLSVNDNATNSPQTATLSGTGQGLPPAVINIAEVIHTTDADLLTPSTLLSIAEVIHTTDADLPTPSTLLNIAEIIHTTDAPVLTPEITIAVNASGLAYSRVSKTYVGAVTLTNTGSASVSGPFQILFTGLTANVTLVNATGTLSGTPYITVSAPASLAPGQSVVVNVQFTDPSNATIHFTPVIQEGSI